MDEDEREVEDEPDFLPQAVVTVRELSEEDLGSLDGDTNEAVLLYNYILFHSYKS